MTPIVNTGVVAANPTDEVLSDPAAVPSAQPEHGEDAKAHRLSLVETIGLGGAGFGVRYRAPGSSFYIEPGAYETFHGMPRASDDPMGRYLGVDFGDEASMDAINGDPGIVTDGFLNRLDANPFRFRVGIQGDILPNKVFGPTVDFSFDPVQMGVAAVRGGQMFTYAFEQGEEAIEPITPYLGEDFDAQAGSAKTVGTVAAGAFTGAVGLAQSLSLGVGFHVRPMESLELGMTAGTTGLGVYRAVRLYSQNGNTTQAVLEATEVKAAATWRF